MYIRVISEETGLYYLQARYYDPETARFISPDETDYLDPQSFGGLNLYIYCLDNPVMYADPSGNSAIVATLIMLGVNALTSFVLTYLTSVVETSISNYPMKERQKEALTQASISAIFSIIECALCLKYPKMALQIGMFCAGSESLVAGIVIDSSVHEIVTNVILSTLFAGTTGLMDVTGMWQSNNTHSMIDNAISQRNIMKNSSRKRIVKQASKQYQKLKNDLVKNSVKDFLSDSYLNLIYWFTNICVNAYIDCVIGVFDG